MQTCGLNWGGAYLRPVSRRGNRMATFARLLSTMMLASALASPVAARAAESNRLVTHEDTVSIVSKGDTVHGTKLRLGLLFRFTKGWHIYWKNAGDAGSLPQLALTRPEHVAIGAFG